MSITPAQRQDAATKGYTLQTYANGFGVWHCKIAFPNGAGNTGDGERLISNARRAAQRAIRAAIEERGNGRDKLPPLRYTVTANSSYSSGALASLTIAEDGVRESANPPRVLTFDFARRENASSYGNPAWSVWFIEESHPFRTTSNASWSYEVSGIRTGTKLEVHFTKAGRIAFARKLNA